MEKSIIIAVDGSIHSRKAIEYTVRMSSFIKDLKYTLINIQPKISEFLIEDARTDAKARSALKDLTKKNQESSNKILDESKSLMIQMGIDEDRIETVTQPVVMGTAKAILDYAKQSLCDAVVLGRRGISRLAESFIGSVTNSVLEHTNVSPVWAVGGEVQSSKMMIAIDGSESALRAVDHASYIIGRNPDVEVTLLHVTPRLRDYCTIEFDDEGDILNEVIVDGDKRCVESFYVHAKKKFEEAGLKESQIRIEEVTSTISIGKKICEEAKKGDFGTVVIGRRGINNSFFMGSVSSHVLSNAMDCAVWLVP